MTPEWLAAIVAIVSAAIAGVAAMVSLAQAKSALRQAASSERSAEAAVEQVIIAKQAATGALRHMEREAATDDIKIAIRTLEHVRKCSVAIAGMHLFYGSDQTAVVSEQRSTLEKGIKELIDVAPFFEKPMMDLIVRFAETAKDYTIRYSLAQSDETDCQISEHKLTAALNKFISDANGRL